MPTTTYETDARCDREIGSSSTGHWHACGRKAVVFSDRSLTSGGRYRLFYCAKHAKFATVAETPSVRIEQTGKVLAL